MITLRSLKHVHTNTHRTFFIFFMKHLQTNMFTATLYKPCSQYASTIHYSPLLPALSFELELAKDTDPPPCSQHSWFALQWGLTIFPPIFPIMWWSDAFCMYNNAPCIIETQARALAIVFSVGACTIIVILLSCSLLSRRLLQLQAPDFWCMQICAAWTVTR
jgi:hypothetical protein